MTGVSPTEVRLYMIVLDKLEKHEKVLDVLRGELGEWWWAWFARVDVAKLSTTC